ncbi:MAG TPA: GNAT family N-acetyltransferase [Acidimicrobiales bacterium]
MTRPRWPIPESSTRSGGAPRRSPRKTDRRGDGGRRTPPGHRGVTLDVLIRAAEPRDAPAIGTIWQRAALAGYEGIFPPDAPAPSLELLTERSRLAIAAQGYNTLVLVACPTGHDGQVVGTVAVAPDPDETSRAQLLRLYVDPGHWGRGIGRRLHDTALEHLRAAGYRVVVLWVLESNVRARSIYEGWGWRATPGHRSGHPGVTQICYLLML